MNFNINILNKCIELLEKAIESNDSDIKLRTNYSGKFMDGQKCVAITGKNSVSLITEAIAFLIEDRDEAMRHRNSHTMADPDVDDDNEDVVIEDYREIIKHLLNYKVDSLGLDTVIYWPNMNMSQTQFPPWPGCDL